MIFLFPAGIIAMTLGNTLIGEEGQAVWRIYASPISPKSLVKSKFTFLTIFSIIVLIITGTIGVVFFHPSISMTIVGFLESLFLVFALGSIGLHFGFRGADFSVTRRARMIRQEWALASFVACTLTGVAILAPLAPFIISMFASSYLSLPPMGLFELTIALVISGVIASVITLIFYKINLGSARELLRKAET